MYKQIIKRSSLLWSFLCIVILLHAQIPAGYYNSAKGQKGKGLKTALYEKIADHKALSYKALWEAYQTTDVRADGKIWDIYSCTTNYSVNDHGSYQKEGDNFNREHSFPKSWFNDAYPMYTDLFHLYPTDGYVNGRRSNYPYGETKGEIYTSNGGFSKLGKSTIAGYSNTVFEPNDEYKGDLARTYFYMATAYEDKISGWTSPMLSGNAYPAYANWALTMLLRWAKEDPVSQKEIDRNNAIYKLQGNRNPYIDYPGLEQYVWGNKTTILFDPDNYDNNGSTDPAPEPIRVIPPSFSITSGVISKGTEITISTPTEGATICYTVNQESLKKAYMSATVTINENTRICAYAMLGENKSQEVVATYTLSSDAPIGNNVYTLVTDASTLKPAQTILIVCNKSNKGTVALSRINDDFRTYAVVEAPCDNSITTEVGGENQPYAITLGGSEAAWTLFDSVSNSYLALSKNGNKLQSANEASSPNSQWKISINNEFAYIYNMAYGERYIQYNNSSPRFAAYTGSQKDVSIYRKAETVTMIAEIIKNGKEKINVYNSQGILIRSCDTLDDALKNLARGIYIINQKKVLIK